MPSLGVIGRCSAVGLVAAMVLAGGATAADAANASGREVCDTDTSVRYVTYKGSKKVKVTQVSSACAKITKIPGYGFCAELTRMQFSTGKTKAVVLSKSVKTKRPWGGGRLADEIKTTCASNGSGIERQMRYWQGGYELDIPGSNPKAAPAMHIRLMAFVDQETGQLDRESIVTISNSGGWTMKKSGSSGGLIGMSP